MYGVAASEAGVVLNVAVSVRGVTSRVMVSDAGVGLQVARTAAAADVSGRFKLSFALHISGHHFKCSLTRVALVTTYLP